MIVLKLVKALALVGENLSNGDVQKHWNAIQKDGIDYADFCTFISTLPERVFSRTISIPMIMLQSSLAMQSRLPKRGCKFENSCKES